jgi:ParB-like chromosome segregation protein Spo0J
MAKKPVAGVPKVPIERVKLADYTAHPDNPRSIGAAEKAALGASLDAFGLVQTIVVNRRTKRFVGGHQRAERLAARGESEADAHVVDLDEERERVLMVQLNDPRSQGRWAPDRLAALLDSLRTKLPDLTREVGLGTRTLSEGGVRPAMDPESKLVRFMAADVKQIVLAYTGAEYDALVPRLASLRKTAGVESNAELLLWLVNLVDEDGVRAATG